LFSSGVFNLLADFLVDGYAVPHADPRSRYEGRFFHALQDARILQCIVACTNVCIAMQFPFSKSEPS
jgi:hypothetical protein